MRPGSISSFAEDAKEGNANLMKKAIPAARPSTRAQIE